MPSAAAARPSNTARTWPARISRSETRPAAAASGGNGDVQATGTAQPFIPADAYNKTPEEDIKVKPKSGCGCETVGAPHKAPWLFAVGPLSALALLVARRRRAA